MKKHLTVDYSKALAFINEEEIAKIGEEIKIAHESLHSKTGKGNEFLGWYNLPNEISDDSINRINKTAEKLRANSEIIVVIGIGGSYLGSKSVIEALSENFDHLKYKKNNHAQAKYQLSSL